ncbi:MAG: NAD-glutamate dehydrogenase [Gammaproteobacteria bacterium]|nr:NAD-glutamate dehydrogenase [Gammaproteobacteria bacterium]
MTRKELRRGSDRKDSIINAIQSARVPSKTLSGRDQTALFLRLYVANIPVEDLAVREPLKIAQIAISHLAFAATRRKGQAKLRIFNPTRNEHGFESPFTFIELVNDDMPFLVNSVTAAINRHDLTVHITVHPIIRVVRDSRGRIESIAEPSSDKGRRESFIRFVVDRETDPQELELLKQEILRVLSDVRLAVRDWKQMRAKMVEARDLLEFGPTRADPELRDESRQFLQWLADDHFTFLGYREYALSFRGDKVFLQAIEGSGLGLLSQKQRGSRTIELTAEMRRLKRAKDWLILTKANSRSTVHRNAYLDYVGVKVYDENGKVTGERRFIGLFASAAYSETPRNIPLLRHKMKKIFERGEVEPIGHRGKALLHIINTYPRDELFHASIQDLARTTIGILNLQDRQRVAFFVRRDAFRRFFSCLVFIPREKYTTRIRRQVEDLLKDTFAGTSVDSSVQISDSALARVHIVVHTPTGDRPRISIQEIEEKIAGIVITWSDRLRDELNEAFGLEDGPRLFRAYRDVFSLGYQADVTPREACSDVKRIEDMSATNSACTVDLYKPETSAPGHMHFMVYRFDEPLALSEAMPLLEAMGVDVYTERPYQLHLRSGKSFWIQDFHLRHDDGDNLDVDAVAPRFEESFMAVLSGRAENDGLNDLVVSAGLDWRETSLVRCYTKYLLQLGMPFSLTYMEEVLDEYPQFVRLLVEQFKLQFDPSLAHTERNERLDALLPLVQRAIDKAKNVDEDRILTAYARAMLATLRSNYFQRDSNGDLKSYISIKLDPSALREVPLPRPKFEIFVYSTEVEGVHLRGGDVARGGLRWSDRREDFRTEVLGLMKAQVVKNTVIVPTGAKGGFFPKRLPEGDRDLILQTGIECYKTFVSGLLDITDNVVNGKVVPPKDVVRRDGDDPYLVVAADKGTATFSDIANEISARYGFWLDDAFASGGSAGYDHKKMGITARGAWEAVKRHFRERGLNTQKDPFTVAGIGDMAGDVFGNGMLLSRKIRLVAAFNHMHIFIDPDPDMAASFKERQRLFKKPRSSWADYNEAIISKGGGVHSRQDKMIRLSAEARKLLQTTEKSMQPDQLIRAILRMPVDLLWNGGIGTYVKASGESNTDVGDRSNDSLRIDAKELRCKVIGEGGNLGLTQRARIEYSLAGGRINTDFIDNSAGVDSSDREVNIKILLSDVVKKKRMSRAKRNELLASMTDDVAALVLRNNYLQTQSISMSEIRSVERIDEIAQLISNLEKTGLLDRELECLPEETEIDERRARKQGFTRPELAVVLSYAKIDVYNRLIDSGDSLEDFLIVDPPRYFPQVLRRRYYEFIPGHRLSRQILATLIANDLVNRMGPAFVRRVQEDTGAHIVTIARAYTVARQICRARSLLQTIESLDNEVPARAQMSMMFEVSRTLRHACYWLINQFGDNLQIEATVNRLKDGMTTIYTRTGTTMSPNARVRHDQAAAQYIDLGVSEQLANRMSALLLTRPALDMADLAYIYKHDVLDTAKLYAAFNQHLGLFWLHSGAEDLKVQGRWQAMARGNLREEFYRLRRELAERFMAKRGKAQLPNGVDKWLDEHNEGVTRFHGMVHEMKLRGELDFATLSVAAQELRHLISS